MQNYQYSTSISDACCLINQRKLFNPYSHMKTKNNILIVFKILLIKRLQYPKIGQKYQHLKKKKKLTQITKLTFTHTCLKL